MPNRTAIWPQSESDSGQFRYDLKEAEEEGEGGSGAASPSAPRVHMAEAARRQLNAWAATEGSQVCCSPPHSPLLDSYTEGSQGTAR